MINVYVIDDVFQAGPGDDSAIEDFGSRLLPGMRVDAYRFRRTEPMRPQVEDATRKAIATSLTRNVGGDRLVVVLDVYFGAVGSPSARLGLDVALPLLVEAGIPVVVFSSLDVHDQAFLDNLFSSQRFEQVRYLSTERSSSLVDFVRVLVSSVDQRALVGGGFRYREQEEIDQRSDVEAIFDAACRSFGSRRLDLPLVAPVSNFVGSAPRPLSEPHAGRLFKAVTPEGTALGVRYEGTALAAKWAASQLRLMHSPYSARFHYFQEMVRVEETTELDNRHWRSFHQAGLETFSTVPDQHARDVGDTIIATVEILLALSRTPTLRFSHVKLLPLVFEDAGLDRHTKRKIISLMESASLERVRTTLAEYAVPEATRDLLLGMASTRGMSLPEGLRAVDELDARFGPAVAEISALVGYVAQQRPATLDVCKLDVGIYRSLDFYSGVTMQGDVEGVAECLGGGAFTGLVESFGAPGPVYAFGMAIGVDRLLRFE